MLPSLRTLLGDVGLGLRLMSDASQLSAEALDVAVQWVHSSDLSDPTPFLSDGNVLLTTGTWLEGADPDIDAYVRRLVDRGLVGLGFGTQVIRAGTPDGLVASCSLHGLPLFEVPYRTPFIAVSRLAAGLIADDAYARHRWALDAQRAISMAALRPDGLRAALVELARSLGHGVALFDDDGSLDRAFPADAIDPIALVGVRREVSRLVGRGQRASVTVPSGADRLTLHTLGGRNRLRGVLAVGGGTSLDQQEREVVASFVGLASLALEQKREVETMLARMRSLVLGLIIDGEVGLAVRTAGEVWGNLPGGSVHVAVLRSAPESVDRLYDALERRAGNTPERFFVGRHDGEIVAILSADARPELDDVVLTFGTRIGLSAAVALGDAASAIRQARRAIAETDTDGGIVSFTDIAERGLLSALAAGDNLELARSFLFPLSAHDDRSGSCLVETLRVWLTNDAQIDRTAAALGVHRHTVRARIQTAEEMLGADLSRFPVRAELWAALVSRDSQE